SRQRKGSTPRMTSAENETPLVLADFAWHGFAGQEAALSEALGSLAIRRGEPTTRTLEDALFVPATALSPIRFEGALLTASGEPVPEARQQRRRSRIGDLVLGELSGPAPEQPERVVE